MDTLLEITKTVAKPTKGTNQFFNLLSVYKIKVPKIKITNKSAQM